MSASIRKISSFRSRKGSLERVPVLPIHEKYAESRHEGGGQDLDPFDDIIGRLPQNLFCFVHIPYWVYRNVHHIIFLAWEMPFLSSPKKALVPDTCQR